MKDSNVKGESKPKTAEKKDEKGHSKSYKKGEKENHRKKVTQNRERDHEPIVQRTKNRISEENESGIALRSAIEALGGLEDDYELVINAPSDDEVSDASAPVDPSLQKDVAKLVKELGFSRHKGDKSWIVENIDGSDVESSEAQRSESEQETRLETTTPQPALPAKSNVHNGKFVFPPSPRWYEALESLPVANVTHPSEHTLETLMSRASSLLDKDVSVYASTSQSTGASSSDAAFLSRVLSSGTLSDRLSALTLMVQASPVHNMRALEGLKALAMKKGGKGEGLKGVRAIVDWWIGGGAPERKLRYFRDQPLLHERRTDAHLVVWYFEDWLKKFFFSILQVLESLLMDQLPYIRMQAMAFIAQLLTNKPEQEQNLLRLLVNKLGDSEKSIASKASYHLHRLLQAHPNMKSVVVRDISGLVLKAPFHGAPPSSKAKKPSTSNTQSGTTNANARYYSILTCNQIVLSSKTQAEKDVALKLIDIYFELFRDILGESGSGKHDNDENTALDSRDGKGREERRKMKVRENVKLKGKERVPQNSANGVIDGTDSSSSAESKLISAILTGINRALPFAGTDSAKLDEHMDTLFRITHEASFNVSIQSLMLIQRVAETKTSVHARYFRTLYASLQDHRLATSSKQAMYLNLLFKSLKMDNNNARVKAFVKRFLQALATGPGYEPSFICGGLFLLGELFTITPGLRKAISSLPESADSYDPKKREPEYSGAASSCIWELVPLLYHYHPSVSLHARQLLEDSPLTANADLALNTLSHFLDLFVYKNPKKPKPRGPSAMQPAAALGNDGNATVRLIKGISYGGLGSKGTVNEEDFWRKKVQDVPANQLFFHKFFNQRQQRSQHIREKVEKRKGRGDASADEAASDKEAGSPGDSSDSDDQEEEIWQAMKKSMPQKGIADVDSADSEDSKESQGPDESEAEEISGQEQPGHSDSEEGTNSDGPFELAIDDDEDLVGSDADAPDGLLAFGSEGSENNIDWDGAESTVLGKRKKHGKQTAERDDGRKRKKRRLKDLPLFASMEDYEALIDAEPEDNI